MQKTMENRINAYAKLLVRVGVNVQKGQRMVISSPVDCAPFARMCAKAAYDAGCREVLMNWSDDHMTRERYLRAEPDVFDTFPSWRADFYNMLSEEGAAWLSIYAEDPETLSGVDADRIRRSSIASGAALKPYRNRQTADFFPWCIASVPTEAWAKKVFPDKAADGAVDALWSAILDAVRVKDGGDPVDEWKRHTEMLKKRVAVLNSHAFRYLKYKNSLGTDLTVELPENHFWEGGSEKSGRGLPFCANMPTEEVFTAPLRSGTNGVVHATRPLVVNGDIADGFSFIFENGKIVNIEAKRGKKILETAAHLDEGASYLGEVALVPFDSPISNSGILFYNTLFDENASCHLAFGDSYPCIEGGTKMTKDELVAKGLNDSIAHEDFMIGSPDLSITGVTRDGREVPVFADGNFAF
ncbi:MAG: aminopeptidase [Oscillospiraceae bacterium]